MKQMLCGIVLLMILATPHVNGDSDWAKRLKAIEQKPITEVAVKDDVDFLYRILEYPAAEHLTRAPILTFEIRINHKHGSEFSGTLRLLVSLPDYSVIREEMKLTSEQALKIGEIFELTEILDLPARKSSEEGFNNPSNLLGLHHGGWEFEAFERFNQQFRKVSRARIDDSSGDRVVSTVREVAAPAIKRATAKVGAWEEKQNNAKGTKAEQGAAEQPATASEAK